MITRLGFLVVASVAAYAVKQANFGRPAHVKLKEASRPQVERKQDSKDYVEEEEEEEEEVKTISSVINPAETTNREEDEKFDDEEEEEDILPEFEDFLSGEIEFSESSDKFDIITTSQYEIEFVKAASELEMLRSLVKELRDREVKLEGELLEYYGLKEQESDVVELQKQLKMKTMEIETLNITINSFQSERKKNQEEIARGVAAKNELESARNKIKEMQKQIELEASQTKGHLLLLKQQVSSLQAKEQEAAKRDAEVEKKLKAFNEMEVEVLELRRRYKELQQERRELTVKLDAAQARLGELYNLTESEMVAKAREEVNKLRHLNEDLVKQVEGLQINRFSEVEELVYLRWVNACLRYELRNYQTPSGKLSARDLSKSLSPKSQERAKRLMLEYAGSERGQGETDMESISSMPSSPGSEDFENASMDSSSSRMSNFGKKQGLIQKLKRWGKSKDDSSAFASPTRSLGGGNSPMRISVSNRPRGPLESLMLRNAGDGVAITTFGMKDQETVPDEAPGGPNLLPIRTRLFSNDDSSLESVATSFHLMSKSIQGVAEDKYPAYKDRHKLALEREKAIKEKAEQARAEKFFGDKKLEQREKVVNLPPKLAQIKEKVGEPPNVDSNKDSNEETNRNGVVNTIKLEHIEKRDPRVPRPPPQPSGSANSNIPSLPPRPLGAPPPSPPPPGGHLRPPPPLPPALPGSLPKGSSASGDVVHRAPELVEFYQTLMKREAKNETTTPKSLISSSSNSASDIRSNMIGEIENRSAFFLAVKADVETQGEFVQSLSTEVRAASFTNIEDVVSFVNWLDEELSFLVDERAVLKHFDWPEGKADALRESAFEYQDLMKLEKQVSSFVDDPKLPCETALKKMYSLLEKVEQNVYALLRTRDMASSRYKDFGIPVDWLSDSGVVGKIKLSSVQLARKYMKRVAAELDALNGSDKEPNHEFLLLQGVRFAFRAHQFAGGFDVESMKAFEELRSRVNGVQTTGSETQ